jgi:NADPH:quinone reductase
MRVIRVTAFGGPEVLVEAQAADPAAGPGQVVIGVAATDVLFLDTQLRAGWNAAMFGVEPPYVPGNGVAGTVISTGDGVDPGLVGLRVVTQTGEFGGRGGYAEQVAVSADGLIPVPDGLDLPVAAALLHDGATALGLLDEAKVKPGEWVLITGAAGGLGTLLVQLAHAAGARVAAAARGNGKLDLAAELGAEVVVDYSEPGWAEKVRAATGGAGVDLVFDGVGGPLGLAAFEIVARGGRFSAHGAPSGGFTTIDPAEAERHEVTVRGIEQVQFAPADGRRMTARALAEAAAGRISPVIGQTFPLERAADAHTAIEARRTLGKTLLTTP